MGIHHAMNPDVYRGLWGHPGHRDCPVLPKGVSRATDAECQAVEDQYLNQLEEVIRYYLINNTGFLDASNLKLFLS